MEAYKSKYHTNNARQFLMLFERIARRRLGKSTVKTQIAFTNGKEFSTVGINSNVIPHQLKHLLRDSGII